MLDQYRLRLKDGTILAVDFDGLRSWLLDEKVMVQPPGSRQWRPLKQLLAQGRPAALIPRPAPVPVSVPAAATPPTRAAETPIPVVPASALSVPVMPPEEYAEPAIPLTVEDTAPLAEPVAPKRSKVDDGIAIIPFKPLEDDEPPIHSTASPAPQPPRRPDPVPEPVNLLDVAAAEVERHSPVERPWKWTPDPRAAAAGPPPIRLAPLDPEPPRVYDDEVLPELEMVEDKAAIAQERVAAIVRDVSQQADRLLHDIAHSPITTSAQAQIAGVARRWAKWNLPAAVVVVVVLGALATRSIWMPLLSRFSRSADRVAAPPPALPAVADVPPPPPEVQAAIERLPHLTPATVQLVMSTSRYGAPDPPEVFRLAYVAADRGTAALTEEEAQELRALRASVLGALRPLDRERVRAYSRMTAGRDLLVAEDARVLGLFTRGVRALPEPRRERLQALLGKAIAAAVKDQSRATPLPR
jgi:hypothetical protein